MRCPAQSPSCRGLAGASGWAGTPNCWWSWPGLTSIRPGWATFWCITLWNCQPACTGLARSPVGGAPQGWQDSNPRHAVLEAAVLAAELHPYAKLKNRPLGVTLRAAPGLGLLIVAFTQLPPRGWAAHYYPGQLELTRKRVCTHTARLARSLLSRVSRNSPFPLGTTTVAA